MYHKLEVLNSIPTLESLNGESLISAQISDHHVLIKGPILIANMLMKCGWSARGKRYNNGFAKEESHIQYQCRIAVFIRALAEFAAHQPLQVIALQEAPIEPADIAYFIQEARLYPSLHPFIASMHVGSAFSVLGVATFFNYHTCHVIRLNENFMGIAPSLEHRVQCFIVISTDGTKSYKFFNTHIPFDLAKTNQNSGKIMALFKQFLTSQKAHSSYPVIIVGDFNTHPEKIANAVAGVEATYRKDNSVLAVVDSQRLLLKQESDTVDGFLASAPIFASHREYKYQVRSIIGRISGELRLFICYLKNQWCQELHFKRSRLLLT
jgi:endonuclease/exonuclease/phosphatase family metal-dependent hydrolase